MGTYFSSVSRTSVSFTGWYRDYPLKPSSSEATSRPVYSSTEPSVSPSGTFCLPLNPAASLPLSPLCYPREERKAEREQNFNSCAPSRRFSSPHLHQVCFPLLFFFLRGKSSETSIVPASCLNTEQLTLSSFCEYKPESCTFVDICAIQPTRKLKLRSRRIISAQQTKDSEHLLRRKDAHAN